jgi:hypothetical protein
MVIQFDHKSTVPDKGTDHEIVLVESFKNIEEVIEYANRIGCRLVCKCKKGKSYYFKYKKDKYTYDDLVHHYYELNKGKTTNSKKHEVWIIDY